MPEDLTDMPLHSTEKEAFQVRYEQLTILYKQALTATVASIVVSATLAVAQWTVVDHLTIILWLSFMSLAVGLRFLSYLFFFQLKPQIDKIDFWENIHVSITVLAGLAWGSAGVVLLPEGRFEYQALTLIVIAGLASGAVTTLSAMRKPVVIFLTLCMLPGTIHFFSLGTDVGFLTGILCLVYLTFLFSSSNQSYNIHLQNITFRIRSRERELAVIQSEQEVIKTANILEMIAKGRSSSDIYDAIALMYEARHPGLRCSMLELEGDKLMHGGAPSLPKAYCDAVHGLQNGPSVGSCGTSTYTGKRVLVENIETDPKWEKIKGVALPHGMRCCWSEPIKNSEGMVLGAFGMYYNHPALPNAEELKDLEAAAQLAGIVMERQHREALLNKLFSSFEHAQDAIIISNLESRIEYVNPEFERMTGYSSEEATGRFVKILRSDVHPQQFYADMQDTILQGKVWRGMLTIKCKDGSLLEVERNIAPVFNENGQMICQVNIQRDMTEHLTLEHNFRQAQKMEALGTLVGGIAHDFNNILGGMTGNLYLVKQLARDMPKVQTKVENLERLSFRAADLIRQLLTFARKDTVRMQRLSLQTFIKEPLSLLKTSIPESVNFECKLCDEELRINGDETQLHQVLMNLINNAKDAVEETGSPKISLSLEPFTADDAFVLEHEYFQKGRYAHICVRDNGCGIPQENTEHLFEPFFTTKEPGKGTGLGLAMVFGAMKTHQGFIEVESVEGKWTAVHIYFPELMHEQAEVEAAVESESQLKGHGEVVLLVDDEEEILLTGKEVLEALGYTVLLANDGKQAVSVFEEHQADIAIVVMDVVMPEMGGVEAAEIIKQLSPNMRVIFTTGYDKEKALPEYVLKQEGLVILSKPFGIADFNAVIQENLIAA